MTDKAEVLAPELLYLQEHACALGRLAGNLSSLELVLRTVLYELAHAPHTPLAVAQPLFSAQRGDQVPLNALTSWAQLGDLIKAFNDSQAAHDPPLHIDPALKGLRDAFAHGRIVGNDSLSNLILMRFAKPHGAVVKVEERHELTLEWMKAQTVRVREALQIAYGRLIEFPTQASASDGV